MRDLVFAAHREAALRNGNASSVMIRACAQLGVSFGQALCGAISSLGELHGPVTQARRVLFLHDEGSIHQMLKSGKLIPGWGNSFFRDGVDPAWKTVADVVDRMEIGQKVRSVTNMLHASGAMVYPNAACFTAVLCEQEEVPEGTELSVFVEARIGVWAEIFESERTSKVVGG